MKQLPADQQHNHFTRDVRPRGECPACDRYWAGVTLLSSPDNEWRARRRR